MSQAAFADGLLQIECSALTVAVGELNAEEREPQYGPGGPESRIV